MTLAGIVRRVRFEQAENASDPMFVTLLPMITLVRLVQKANAFPPPPACRVVPIWVTLSGIVTLVRLVQPLNASPPMMMTPLGMVTFVRLVQFSNACAPMLVTLPG